MASLREPCLTPASGEKEGSPPRSPRLALRAALALEVGRVLVGAGTGAGADDGAGVVITPHQVRLANRLRLLGRTILSRKGRGGSARLFRQLAGDRFFGAADGQFVEGILAEIAGGFGVFGREAAAAAQRGAGFVAAGGGEAGGA